MGEVAVKIKVEESGIKDEIAKQLKQVLVDHPGNKGDLNEPLEEFLEVFVGEIRQAACTSAAQPVVP